MNIVFVSLIILFTVFWIIYRIKAYRQKKNWTPACSIRSNNRFRKVAYYVPKASIDEDNIKVVKKESIIDESQIGCSNCV